jgi:hypothetical protein
MRREAAPKTTKEADRFTHEKAQGYVVQRLLETGLVQRVEAAYTEAREAAKESRKISRFAKNNPFLQREEDLEFLLRTLESLVEGKLPKKNNKNAGDFLGDLLVGAPHHLADAFLPGKKMTKEGIDTMLTRIERLLAEEPFAPGEEAYVLRSDAEDFKETPLWSVNEERNAWELRPPIEEVSEPEEPLPENAFEAFGSHEPATAKTTVAEETALEEPGLDTLKDQFLSGEIFSKELFAGLTTYFEHEYAAIENKKEREELILSSVAREFQGLIQKRADFGLMQVPSADTSVQQGSVHSAARQQRKMLKKKGRPRRVNAAAMLAAMVATIAGGTYTLSRWLGRDSEPVAYAGTEGETAERSVSMPLDEPTTYQPSGYGPPPMTLDEAVAPLHDGPDSSAR